MYLQELRKMLIDPSWDFDDKDVDIAGCMSHHPLRKYYFTEMERRGAHSTPLALTKDIASLIGRGVFKPFSPPGFRRHLQRKDPTDLKIYVKPDTTGIRTAPQGYVGQQALYEFDKNYVSSIEGYHDFKLFNQTLHYWDVTQHGDILKVAARTAPYSQKAVAYFKPMADFPWCQRPVWIRYDNGFTELVYPVVHYDGRDL